MPQARQGVYKIKKKRGMDNLFLRVAVTIQPIRNMGLAWLKRTRLYFAKVLSMRFWDKKSSIVFAPIGQPQKKPRRNRQGRFLLNFGNRRYSGVKRRWKHSMEFVFSMILDRIMNGKRVGTTELYQRRSPSLAPRMEIWGKKRRVKKMRRTETWRKCCFNGEVSFDRGGCWYSV